MMGIRLAALAAFLCGACASAATLIAAGTYLVEGQTAPNRQPDCNSIIIEAPRGLIVFDTGRHPEHTQQLLDFARKQGRPIAAIINSHWHLDHVGGNPLLRAAFPGIEVYASDAINAARTGFLADYRAQLVSEIANAAKQPDAQAAMRAEMALIDAGTIHGLSQGILESAGLRRRQFREGAVHRRLDQRCGGAHRLEGRELRKDAHRLLS
jgi:glyoxylase-like metal-dependent hydrolase (beta-lactamase superfamily II)